MANPNTAHEPSMEEILASIRQIISEDGENASNDRFEADGKSDAETASSGPDDLEHKTDHASFTGEPMKAQSSERAASQPGSSAQAETARRGDTSLSGGQAPATSPFGQSGAARAAAAPRNGTADSRGLMSRDSDSAVSGAFNALAHTILAQNARTLEDLVSEMLRPMLREWLDDNLPSLVERLVEDEIHRVSRGRR